MVCEQEQVLTSACRGMVIVYLNPIQRAVVARLYCTVTCVLASFSHGPLVQLYHAVDPTPRNAAPSRLVLQIDCLCKHLSP